MGRKYASASVRQYREDNIRGIEKQLNDPIAAKRLANRQRMITAYKKEKAELQALTPPPIQNEAERKAKMARCDQLENAMVRGDIRNGIEPMLSHREMWDTPAGSVGRLNRWRNRWNHSTVDSNNVVQPAKDGYGAVFEWKDLRNQLLLDRESEDGEITSIEMIRPQDPVLGNDRAVDYRKVSYAMPAVSQEKYDEACPGHEKTFVEQKLQEYHAQEGQPNEPVVIQHPDDFDLRCTYVDPETKRRCGYRNKTGRCKRHRLEK